MFDMALNVEDLIGGPNSKRSLECECIQCGEILAFLLLDISQEIATSSRVIEKKVVHGILPA